MILKFQLISVMRIPLTSSSSFPVAFFDGICPLCTDSLPLAMISSPDQRLHQSLEGRKQPLTAALGDTHGLNHRHSYRLAVLAHLCQPVRHSEWPFKFLDTKHTDLHIHSLRFVTTSAPRLNLPLQKVCQGGNISLV